MVLFKLNRSTDAEGGEVFNIFYVVFEEAITGVKKHVLVLREMHSYKNGRQTFSRGDFKTKDWMIYAKISVLNTPISRDWTPLRSPSALAEHPPQPSCRRLQCFFNIKKGVIKSTKNIEHKFRSTKSTRKWGYYEHSQPTKLAEGLLAAVSQNVEMKQKAYKENEAEPTTTDLLTIMKHNCFVSFWTYRCTHCLALCDD